MAEAFIDPDINKDGNNIGETLIALLLGVPYIVDFCSGISTFLLAYNIFEYEENLEE